MNNYFGQHHQQDMHEFDYHLSNKRKPEIPTSDKSLELTEMKQFLINLQRENSFLQSEIDKTESQMAPLIEQQLLLGDEASETKAHLTLLKKSIDVKKTYLESLMKSWQSKSEKNESSFVESNSLFLKKISLLCESINNLNHDFNQEMERLEYFDLNRFNSIIKSVI